MLLWYIVGEVNKMPRKERTPFQRNLETLFDEYKRALFEKGLTCTREMFAQHIGATLGKFKGWMSGSGEPSSEMLVKIARASDVSVDWLVGASPERKPAELVASKGGLVSKIAGADSETLAQMEQFFDYLQFVKRRGEPASNDK